MDHLKSKVFWN